MARNSRKKPSREIDWTPIIEARASGKSFASLAKEFGVPKGTIYDRANSEGWGNKDDLAKTIAKLATEKAAGIPTEYGKKREKAIDAAATNAAGILQKHRNETEKVRTMLNDAIELHSVAESRDEKILAFEDLKAAKISSEAMLNLHKLERQAWNLETSAVEEIYIANPREVF